MFGNYIIQIENKSTFCIVQLCPFPYEPAENMHQDANHSVQLIGKVLKYVDEYKFLKEPSTRYTFSLGKQLISFPPNTQ